jgi:imidazolonepropionase-like amidohydrolase
MDAILFENATLLDVVAGELRPDRHVLVEDERIKEVADRPLAAAGARRVDLRGRTLMPGLCDAHVHVTQLTGDLGALRDAAPSYVSAQASVVLREMLARGFTTVRDAGGADYGLAAAVDDGYFTGPRLLFAGHALSQTGGHGDHRSKGQDTDEFSPWRLGRSGRVCDGVAEVRKAARDELRKGAHAVKVMVSGGVTSPLDHIESLQFSPEELRAAVEEAEGHGRYVMAHAYTAPAIQRALDCGVRSIEHGNLLDEPTALRIRSAGAFLVPTLVVYWAMHREGREAGMSATFQSKVAAVHDAALRGLEIAHRAGVRMAFGSDLFGPMHRHQSLELSLRAEVQKPIEVIRQATADTAELFGMTGEIGAVVAGARADLLVVDGDPTADLGLLQGQGRHLDVIMKDGRFVVNRL